MFKGLKSLLVGTLAGIGLGVLFSPKKGTDFRKNLKSEVDKGGTGLSTIKDTFVKMGKDIGGTCKDCYNELSETEEFKKGKKELKKYAGKAYKKNIPAKTRRKAKSIVSKIKKKL